jgi:hypothetical protein
MDGVAHIGCSLDGEGCRAGTRQVEMRVAHTG